MAITIRNITDDQIDVAKRLTGKGTASAGVVACVDLAASQALRIAELNHQVRELREKCNHSDSVINHLASAADEALCIVRQKELLQ